MVTRRSSSAAPSAATAVRIDGAAPEPEPEPEPERQLEPEQELEWSGALVASRNHG